MPVIADLHGTRASTHMLAEHILAAARYAVTGRIGLTVIEGGIATPPFGDEERTIALIGGELVVRTGHDERHEPVSTLRAAGEFVDIDPGGPAEVYTLATPCNLDERLDLSAIRPLLDWYALGAEALRIFRQKIEAETPSDLTLWPEHLDVAIRSTEVNYGALAGDSLVPEPYMYVGPGSVPPSRDDFWNHDFGAVETWSSVTSVADAVAFFREGHGRLFGG